MSLRPAGSLAMKGGRATEERRDRMRSRIFRARGRLSCMRAAAFSLIFLAATAHAAWTPVIGTRVAAAPPIAHLTPIEDGAGGAFLLTFDEIPYPGDAPHVFAHHVLSTGDLASNWPAGGAPACSTSVVDVGCYNAPVKELSAWPGGGGRGGRGVLQGACQGAERVSRWERRALRRLGRLASPCGLDRLDRTRGAPRSNRLARGGLAERRARGERRGGAERARAASCRKRRRGRKGKRLDSRH